ncbi:MAG TPA: signal recognition particle-docking protein FtsY [Limnochordia bacterium]|nr:signal recognition particle-docking protein FtsY [Limnochordia bacterium]
MAKSRTGLVGKIAAAVRRHKRIDEALYEELEEALIQGDVGVETTLAALESLRERVRAERITEPEALLAALSRILREPLGEPEPLQVAPEGPSVYLIVGVNGAGKTTSIGKLAHQFGREGKRVIVAAGDTFRAAAQDQLGVWAERAGVELIAHQAGSDPAAVAFDAVQAAIARGVDIVLIDTAGRLPNKPNLMQELNKVYRVTAKALGREPDEVLLVLDATTGQNALSQAKLFREAVPVSGVMLTKLDMTAKGGIVLAVAAQHGVRVKAIGIGEGIEDLRPFDPDAFIAALFAREAESPS